MTYEHSIILRGIKKKVEPFLLGPIDLEIPSGFITAIVGPNGSGKSDEIMQYMIEKHRDSTYR